MFTFAKGKPKAHSITIERKVESSIKGNILNCDNAHSDSRNG